MSKPVSGVYANDGAFALKILAISHLYPNAAEPRYGVFVARQLEAMVAAGAQIEVVVPRLYSPKWLNGVLNRPVRMDHTAALLSANEILGHSVAYFSWPGKSFKRRAGKAMYRAVRPLVTQRHQSQRFDIVYGTDWFLGCDVAHRIARQLKLPSAGLAIGDDVNITAEQSRRHRKQFIQIANGLTATLACGNSLAQKIDAVRNGSSTMSVYGVVDLDLFSPLANKTLGRNELRLPVDKILFLYVGYLWKRKGLFELIQAFEDIRLGGHDVALVVCGDGEDGVAIRHRIRQSPASEHIHLQGTVHPNEIHRYMQASDVFVLPSYSEGMPNAVMEAMACGLPAICTAVGGLPDALQSCTGAKLVAPREQQALRIACEEVLNDVEQRQAMGRAARAFAESEFGALSNARKILNQFQQAIDAPVLKY